MKHKRMILTSVLMLAVTAVVVPNLQALWMAAAYEERESGTGVFSFWKRFAFLPGEEMQVPDQPCGYCKGDEHRECEEIMVMLDDSGRFDLYRFHCTCSHRSHDVCDLCHVGSHSVCDGSARPDSRVLWVDPCGHPRHKGRCTCSDPSHERNR